MYRPDHPLPHFHARYGDDEAKVEIGSWRVITGSPPARALRLVREWAQLHENELLDNWDRAQALEPLAPSIPFRSMNVVLRVTEVEPLDDHRLRVSFNDGVVRDVDCSFLFHGALGEPLRDPTYFTQVCVDGEGGRWFGQMASTPTRSCSRRSP